MSKWYYLLLAIPLLLTVAFISSVAVNKNKKSNIEEIPIATRYSEFILQQNKDLDTEEAQLIVEEVKLCSAVSGIDEAIILSMISLESSYNPLAVSPAGAIGLMQVHAGVWPNASFSISSNIRQGCSILIHYYLAKHRNIAKTLQRYNGGGDDYPLAVLKLAGEIRREYGKKKTR